MHVIQMFEATLKIWNILLKISNKKGFKDLKTFKTKKNILN